ncbi:MAG: hypothetical protein RR623_06430 [Bacilli bacterium]
MINIENILNKLKVELEAGLPFMEGRTKGDILEGVQYTVINFGTLHGDDGEYVVFITKEDDTKFFFGGQVITEKLVKISNLLKIEELNAVLENGNIKVTFESKKSNKGRIYLDASIKFE